MKEWNCEQIVTDKTAGCVRERAVLPCQVQLLQFRVRGVVGQCCRGVCA